VPRYSEEHKAAVLAKFSPPLKMTVAALARNEGISEQTLYNWRTQAREKGRPVPGSKAKSATCMGAPMNRFKKEEARAPKSP